MEGPSLFLAAKQLQPFKKKIILEVAGNTKVGKERLLNKKVLEIFSWGKHLVFQFDTFAMRIHFMLYGSFEAVINDQNVTGDYPTKNRPVRLALYFKNGRINMYNCSIKFIEESNARAAYDYTIDIMSPKWDPHKAFIQIKSHPQDQIGDLLLEQSIFAGVGNIIKNETLYLAKISPERLAATLSDEQIDELIKLTQAYSRKFYLWRKRFVLKKHYQVYRKSICPNCGGKVARRKTGVKQRFSYVCPNCQR